MKGFVITMCKGSPGGVVIRFTFEAFKLDDE